ncbi:MAG: hypothetical protein LBU65_10280 [Planctomycetaceae bacterium]|jgi:predicted oxidoreductase (fatty acid repression mutant protein)|nr:hypothetical protein [Planctomycetaceae bacterium]
MRTHLLLTILFVGFTSVFLFGQDAAPDTAVADEKPIAAADEEWKWTTFDPKKSYVQLLMPRIANRLGLTDVQRAEVQRLANERAQKLAALPLDKKELWEPAILENEAKLEALLTPQQKELWPKVFADKKIKFIFNNQKWEDVLNMFADMAGLQLIMDSPPPATFNYSDNLEYTPAEAIDKLNSVLQTKGYTLIRNGNMLMLFNLTKGRIPAQFVPKIKIEDLTGRGDFEYSTVVFPLGRRNRSMVLQTIEPFKSEYSYVVPMTGNSLMITDTTGALRVIDKVIQGVYEPPGPSPPDPHLPPPPPTWQVYAFEKVDVPEIEKILREFYSDLKILRLGNSKQVYIFAPPGQHAAIKSICDMLDAIAAPMEKRSVVAYPVESLLGMTPQRLWQMSRRGRGQSGGGAGAVPYQQFAQMQQYPGFNPIDANVSVMKEIADILEYAVPGAIVSVNTINNKLVVLATDEDHKTVKKFIDDLRTTADELPPEDQPVVKLYQFADPKKKFDDETVKMVRAVVPDNQVIFAEENSRVLIVATAKEHDKVSQAVKEIEAAVVPVEDRTLVVYRLHAPAISRLHQALVQLKSDELKNIVELRDSRAGSLSIIATAKQHEAIRKLIGEITGAAANAKGELPVIRVDVLKFERGGSAAAAYQVFSTMFPNIDLTIDYPRNALIANGTADELNVLKMAHEELVKDDSHDVLFIPLKRDLPQAVVTSLNRIAPHAVVQIDKENKQAIVYGTVTDIKRVEDAIAQSQNVEPPKEELVTYVPKFGMEQFRNNGAANTIITERFTEAKILTDSAGQRLMIRVSPANVEPLKELLATLDVDPDDGEETFIYQPKKISISDASNMIRTQLPRLQVTTDATGNRIITRVRAEDKAKLVALIEKIDVVDAKKSAMIVFTPQHIEIATARSLLADIYPDAQISNDTENSRLVIRLAAEDEAAVNSLLTKLDTLDPNAPKRSFRTYPISVGASNAQAFVADIQKLVPKAKLTFDAVSSQLVVWGTDEEQKIVSDAIGNLQDTVGAAKRFKRIAVNRGDVGTLINTLYRLYPYPAITVSYDTVGRTLVLEGHPNVLKQAAELLALLDPTEPGPNATVVRFYKLNTEPSQILIDSLNQLVPGVTIVPDKEAKQLMAIATPRDQDSIASNVKEIAGTFTPPEEPMFFIYHVNENERRRVEEFVNVAKPQLKDLSVVKDVTPGQLTVWAKPTEHKLLASVLEQMKVSGDDGVKKALKVYPFRVATTKIAEETLQIAVPEVVVIADNEGYRVMLWGDETALEKANAILTQLDEPDEKQRFTLGVYSFGDADPLMVESTLRSIVPDAESTSSDDLVFRLGYQHRMERTYGYNMRQLMRNRNTPNRGNANAGIFRVDAEQRKVFVFVSAADHKIVEDAMTSLSKSFENTEKKLVKRFVMRRTRAIEISASIMRVYPSVLVTVEADGNALIVETFARTIEDVEKLIDSLDPETPTTNDPVTKFYTLDTEPTPLLMESLRRIAPTASFYQDPDSNQIMVIAKPHEHTQIAENVKSITDSYTLPEEPMLVVYPISDNDRQQITSFINTAKRKLKTMVVVQGNQTPGQITVWGTPTEHNVLSAAIDEIKRSRTIEPSQELRVFTIEPYNIGAARQLIYTGYPHIRFFPDERRGRLILWGDKETLDTIDKQIAELENKSEPRTYKRYAMRRAEPYQMYAIVQRLYPDVRVTFDYSSLSIVVEGIAGDHKKIKSLLEELDPVEQGPNDPMVKFYKLGAKPSQVLLNTLNRFAPTATIQPDPDGKQLMVIARPNEHALFARTLQQIIETYTALEDPIFVSYPVDVQQKARLNAFIQTARSELKNLQVVPDNQNGQLSIWATPTEHALLTTVLKQIQASNDSEVTMEMRTFPMSAADISTAQQVLTAAHPDAKLFPDQTNGRLLVWGTPALLDKVDETLRVSAFAKTINVITIPDGSTSDRTRVIKMIQTLFPDSNPTEGASSNQILVWGGEALKKRVQQVIDESCKPVPAEQQTIYKTYPIQFAQPSDLVKYLKSIAPNATFEQSQVRRAPYREDTKAIIALATPLEHLEIAKTIAEIDKDAPDGLKAVPRFYSLQDFPPGSFWNVFGTLYRTFTDCSLLPGGDNINLTIVATENTHAQIEAFLKKFLEQQERGRRYVDVYMLTRTNFPRVIGILTRLTPNATITPGSAPDIVVVVGNATEQREIMTALAKLEMDFSQRPAGANAETSGLKVYKIAGRRAYVTAPLVQQQFTTAIIRATDEEQLLVWASPSEHEQIAKMVNAVAEAYPDPSLKTYFVKHIPIGEAFASLVQLYSRNEAIITLRRDTGDLMVQADDAVHARVARSIEQLDQPRPASVEKYAKAHDVSELPAERLPLVANTIRAALPELLMLPGSVAGQLVIWGREEEQKRAALIIDEILSEREDAAAEMKTYLLKKASATSVTALLRQLAPNAKYNTGLETNQLMVWAKPSDQRKIANAIENMNEDVVVTTLLPYSLKNVNEYTAAQLIGDLLATRGLSTRAVTHDYYGSRLFVEADDETHKLITNLLEKMKAPDRDLDVFTIEKVDLETARMAVYAMFSDESYDTSPRVEVDSYTNTLFLRGTQEQLERTRKMLIKMGETQFATEENTEGGTYLPKRAQSKLRVIHVEGNVDQTIKEIEKLWPQINNSPLHINRQNKPIIQEKPQPVTPPSSSRKSVGFYAIADDVAAAAAQVPPSEPAAEPTPTAVTPQQSPVYVIVNDDGSLTITSNDTRSLDQLQQLLERVSSRVVFEGRDYTIYSVRNVSASDVAMKLQLVLRDRLAGRTQLPRTRQQYGFGYQTPRVPLEILPEINSNTIYVKGSKAERNEVEELITMFDVSELPGERVVRKPIRVHIKNTQAYRIVQQVTNVYQQKLQAISLPGGVRPRITPDNLTNSIDIIAPEPLATELKEYAEELDRRTVEEPSRKVHVIPLKVNSRVISEAMNIIRQSQNQPMGYQNQMYYQGW